MLKPGRKIGRPFIEPSQALLKQILQQFFVDQPICIQTRSMGQLFDHVE